MFYTNESYQGAQKRIYPYAIQDHLTPDKVDKEYTSLVLENDFLELAVLPEIGGRLFSAVDKTNDYDFFYRQDVIKPALVGLAGPWISGGVVSSTVTVTVQLPPAATVPVASAPE